MPSNIIPFRHPIHAPAYLGAVGGGFGRVWFVANSTNPAEDADSTPMEQGTSPRNPFPTITLAVAAATGGRGDTIIIQRGTYTENVAFNKAGLLVMSAVPYGYPDHVIIAGTSTVTVANCTFVNLEFFANASSASVTINTAAASGANSTWFEHCSFASDGTTEPTFGCQIWGSNDTVFNRCYFIDNTRGVHARANSVEFVTGLVVQDCEFLENTTHDIGNVQAGQQGSGSGPRNTIIHRNLFAGGEVIPTSTLELTSSAGPATGLVAENYIQRTTNASATIIIPGGLLYAANATEAGHTTARPS